MSHLHEECGVFGIYSPVRTDVAHTVYYGLYALQHRGQESCGIVVNDDGLFSHHKDIGLVGDVFTPEILNRFPEGNIGVGHVRYGTTSTNDRENSQPIVVNHVKGRMALCMNGDIVNALDLRRELELQGSIFHSTSNAEILSHIFIKARLNTNSIEEAIEQSMDKLVGAYSIVAMSPAKLLAVRDPLGMHPLCYGVCEDGSVIFASESCALETVHAKFIRDIEPGEIIVCDKNGLRSIKTHCGKTQRKSCIFEHIYFARPDSVIDGVNVHQARLIAGACLARRHPVDADVVIGVPDSGLDAALGYARESGIPYGVGFIKNRYIGRTFIAPGQGNRKNLVRIKLNPVSSVVKGKKVVMIDDSIVRGTTSERIVKLLREAGATEVHVRASAPPFINLCYYGTDIDSKENLIACRMSIPEIKNAIGADSLGFLDLEDLREMVGETTGDFHFCSACFDGNYPTEVPEEKPKYRFDKKISEGRK